MKLKGINPLERHIEWIVLVLITAVLIGFTAMQFIGVDEVEVGNNSVPLGRAYEPVERSAQRLQNTLNDPNPEIPEYTPPSLGAEIDALLADAGRPPAPRELALGNPIPLDDTQAIYDPTEPGTGEGFAIGDLTPPAPSSVIAAGYLATLDPREPVRFPGLASLLPSSQPLDTPGVTVEATYDGTALREIFETDPDGPTGPLVAAPSAWWLGETDLYAVQAERREQLPDGSWSEPVLMGALPGQVDLLGRLQRGELPEEEAAAFAAEFASEIAAAPFYVTIAGPDWASPSELARLEEVAANRPRIDRLLADRQNRLDTIVELEQEIGGGGGGGGAGGRDGRGGQRQSAGNEQEDPRIAQLRQRIESLRAEVAQIESRLRPLGWTEEGENEGASRPEARGSLLSDDSRTIWIHDLSVRPGGEYSYRLRVVTNNILRGRGNILAPEDRSRAADIATFGEWSDWTPVIEAPAREYAFLTAARSQADLLGPGQPGVNAEIYRFYYGYWRRASAEFQPGDLIDIEIGLPSGDTLPIFQRSAATVPEGGGGAAGGGRDGRRGGAQGSEETDRLQGVTFTPAAGADRLQVSTGLMLLDVATAEGVDQGRLIYLRDGRGRIILRRPELDRDSPLRRRLERSAAAAADQPTPTLERLTDRNR